MPRKLAFPAAALAALMLIAAACDQQPTEVQEFPIDGVAFSYTGFTGVTDDAPQSTTSVEHSEAFPSTNLDNIAKNWANVTWNSDDAGLGEAPLKFSPNTAWSSFASCFEYRIDDAPPSSAANHNAQITDGLWEFQCVSQTSGAIEVVLNADSHVDVRLSFGAERDERFDWTRFYVMAVDSKEQCQNGGWQEYGFANQGQCIRYVETGKK